MTAIPAPKIHNVGMLASGFTFFIMIASTDCRIMKTLATAINSEEARTAISSKRWRPLGYLKVLVWLIAKIVTWTMIEQSVSMNESTKTLKFDCLIMFFKKCCYKNIPIKPPKFYSKNLPNNRIRSRQYRCSQITGQNE